MFWKKTIRSVEISTESVRWAEVKRGGGHPSLLSSSDIDLPKGLVLPSLSKENISDKDALKSEVLKAIPPNRRKGEVTLTLPDSLSKISFLHFDELPQKREEIEKLILWQLKKTVPLSPEMIKLDFAVIPSPIGGIDLQVAIASKAVIREYEDILIDIGLTPRLIDIVSLNTLNFFINNLEASALFAAVSDNSVSLSVVEGGKLAFFRSKEVGKDYDKITKELVSTINYCQTTNTVSAGKNLYIHLQNEESGIIINNLEKVYEGKVIPLRASETTSSWDNPLENEAFVPLIGSALRSIN